MTVTDEATEPADAGPAVRLSWPRLGVVLVVLAAAAWAITYWVRDVRAGETPLGESASV